MTDLAVKETATDFAPGYGAPYCTASGDVASTAFRPDDVSLWLVGGRLGAGAVLEWSEEHGDEGVYVSSGELRVNDRACRAGGAVIVEAGATATVAAARDTVVVHVGPSDPDPANGGLLGDPDCDGHGVHVVTAADAHVGGYAPMRHVTFADSRCATCRINFFRIDCDEQYDTPSHLHSQDEIIHVVSGSLRVGRHVLSPGTSVAIPSERRYALRTTGAFSFLNYRRDASSVTVKPGSEPHLES